MLLFELWVVYEGESCLGRDPRNPKRKLAWSGTHYSKSYTVVQNRTLEDIPRFTVDDKAAGLGARGDLRFRTRSCPERC